MTRQPEAYGLSNRVEEMSAELEKLRAELRELLPDSTEKSERKSRKEDQSRCETESVGKSKGQLGRYCAIASLPDPRLIDEIIRNRDLRSRHFPPDLFADPAWDMLLDLARARAEFQRISITSLCIASRVPPTTALRWIKVLCDTGLCEREQDDRDKRRIFISLSDAGAAKVARYFRACGRIPFLSL